MALANERSASLFQAQFRALHAVFSQKNSEYPEAPNSQVLTVLMRHGGLYTLLDEDMMTARLVPMLSGQSGMTAQSAANFVQSLGSAVASFFMHLKPVTYYVLDSSLISHLSFPGPDSTGTKPRGLTFTPDMPTQPPGLVSPTIPAAFTFIGQFIDHDLTMNAVDLFNPQTGEVQNTASPLIDLDSVYGPRTILFNAPAHGSIYNSDGTFKLHKKEGSAAGHFYDLPRQRATHKAYISDARNDENQMILQVHLLVIKLHNKLLTTVFNGISDPLKRFQAARKETIYNWQSMIMDDYLRHTLLDKTLDELLVQIAKKNFGDFKYKPCLDLTTGKYVASLPHEFAIGFRFGHSQLKPKYQLRDQTELIILFDNSLVSDAHGNFNDLRGSQPLLAEHVIDWEFFAGGKFLSNLIDGKVTSVVFDLPESAIPDDIKFVGNLIQRNLIRSSQVGLCCGEELAEFYGIKVLTPDQIDPDPNARGLYVARDSNGNVQMTDGHDTFQTPLWYYLLKEAELEGKKKGSLGRLGSRLVGEVVLGAIAWADESVFKNGRKDPNWKSKVPLANPDKVTLLDLANFVVDY